MKIIVWGRAPGGGAGVRELAERHLAGGGLLLTDVGVLRGGKPAWRKAIGDFLAHDEGDCLITVGGSGFPAEEFVPDVTEDFIRRPAPGIPEAIRGAGAPCGPAALLFRGTAGLADGGRLIVNLPAEGEWLASSFSFLKRIMGHALAKSHGDQGECGRQG